MDPAKKKALKRAMSKPGKNKQVTRTEILLRRQSRWYSDVLRFRPHCRTGDKKWLETHIWHAKRMKMNDIWGYRLVCLHSVGCPLSYPSPQAEHSTEKLFRPSHRAALHGCILHDASYTALIELKGKQELLRRVLNGCSDPHESNPGAAT
jgi:ribonuclease P/MRP protein subunit POP1